MEEQMAMDVCTSEPSQVSKSIFPTDNEGKIEFAVDLKNTGNDHFKQGNFKKAIVSYSKAMAFTKGLPGRTQGLEGIAQMAAKAQSDGDKITPEQDLFINELELTLKTNIATSYIKMGDALKALDVIQEILKIKPTAWKAIMRKAEAKLLLNDPDKALSVLEEAVKYCPTEDQQAHAAIEKVKQNALLKLKKEDAKQRKAFGNIFERAQATADKA